MRGTKMDFKQKIKKLAIGTAIVSTLFFSAPKNAEANSAELMISNKSSSLDTKLGGDIYFLNFFNRNRISTFYNGKADYFGDLLLSGKLPLKGLGWVLETQITPETGLMPRIGLQYFNNIKNFGFYILSTTGLENNLKGEVFFDLSYNSQLIKDINLVLKIEETTDFNTQGHLFSIQRLRAGIKYNKLSLGLAANLIEAKGNFSYDLGGFVKADF